MSEETKKETPPKKEEMVEVSKAYLDKLADELAALKQNQNLLLATADKKRVAIYHQRNKGKVPNMVCLREMNGKVVVGWQSTMDIVEKISPLKWREDQRTKLLYADGTTEEMRQRDFEVLHKKIECDRVGVSTNEETGQVIFKLVRRDTGEEHTVGVQFVN